MDKREKRRGEGRGRGDCREAEGGWKSPREIGEAEWGWKRLRQVVERQNGV